MLGAGRRSLDPRRSGLRRSGFTLVEMAVVLIIIGLLILTVFPALIAVRTSSERGATQSNLQALMLATAAYVQANGCLPCPAPSTAAGNAFGRIAGSTGTSPCLTCAAAEGIVPYVSLGISANVARDGWGHWITMRVDPSLTASAFNAIAPPTAACTAADLAANPVTPTCTLLGASQKGLCQANLLTAKNAAPVSVATLGGATQQAAVIFVSHGSHGYGSYAANPIGYQSPCYPNIQRLNFPGLAEACVQALSCNMSGNGTALAECNADGNNQFVNAPTQDGYDDMMVYADRNTLISMLGNGACQTVW